MEGMTDSAAAAPVSRRTRLLVVEDDIHIARLLELVLEKAGYAVTVAHRAEDARELLRREEPDAILLDVILPGISGLDFLREVRADPKWSGHTVIMMSGNELDDEDLAAAGNGITVQCPKPITPSRLRSQLQECGVNPRIGKP